MKPVVAFRLAQSENTDSHLIGHASLVCRTVTRVQTEFRARLARLEHFTMLEGHPVTRVMLIVMLALDQTSQNVRFVLQDLRFA